jgi:DNA polymerase zeta
MGCILVSKKRYVGYKFDSATQEEGEIESKGIETVRRDSCGVVQIAMRECLGFLFRTRDLSKVKQHLHHYWMQMLDEQLPLRDFIFAKEVRLGTYSDGRCVHVRMTTCVFADCFLTASLLSLL